MSRGEGHEETLAHFTWLSIFSSTREVLCGRASTRRRIPAPEMKLDSTFSVFNALFSLSISARALNHQSKERVPMSHPGQGWRPSRLAPKILGEPCREQESSAHLCCLSQGPGKTISIMVSSTALSLLALNCPGSQTHTGASMLCSLHPASASWPCPPGDLSAQLPCSGAHCAGLVHSCCLVLTCPATQMPPPFCFTCPNPACLSRPLLMLLSLRAFTDTPS